MEGWARQHHLNKGDIEASSHANAMALGGVDVLDAMLQVTHEEIQEFYEKTGGVGEFKYEHLPRRENQDSAGGGVDVAG